MQNKENMGNKKTIALANVTGLKGEVKVTIDKATFQENEDFSLQFVHPEFGSWLVEQIFLWEKVIALKKGLFRKKYFCSGCGTELNPLLRSPLESIFQLEFSDYPPFSLRIVFPCVKCPQCEKSCGIDLDDSLEDQITEAIMNAFESANISNR